MTVQIKNKPLSATNGEHSASRCPIDHTAFSQQKTAQVTEPAGQPLDQDAAGVWHVYNFAEARAILRQIDTKQAGFRAELIERMPRSMKLPVLYQEGEAHLTQRKQTARFFTPKATSTNYRHLMETLSDQIVAELKRDGRADLSALSMRLAVQVAAQVIGLTSSRLPGMDKRIDAFFTGGGPSLGWHPRALYTFVRNQLRVAAFFYLDVLPAIQARKRQPQEDLISHLIEQGYGNGEILTECITYGAAGMATTREFISVAAWHLLEQPALRTRFLTGSDAERDALLQETLRLEPVVGHLYRRATADLHLESKGQPVTIPAGDLIDLHVYAINGDESVVGTEPRAICPGRQLASERVPAAVMSFGDGHHRCPGAYIAIQESDIFLQRLLALDGLHMDGLPTLTWSDITKGYELRDFMIRVN